MTKKKAPAISAKQSRFVEEYLVDGNGKRAALAAGYSPRTAESQASRLLRNAKVAAVLEKAQAKRSERVNIKADRVLEELGRLGFSNMLDFITTQGDGSAFVDLSKLSRDQAAAISSFKIETYWEPGLGEDDPREVKKVTFKLADKRAALESIGKHLGMFKTFPPDDPDAPLVPNRPLKGLPAKELRQIIAANKLLEKIANDSSGG